MNVAGLSKPTYYIAVITLHRKQEGVVHDSLFHADLSQLLV